ncbi:MAG: 4Fe-4S dicluster domain-containing protein [Eubacteriales bacterium]
MQELMKKRAIELLSTGEVDRVIGWKKGEFAYDPTPAVFTDAKDLWDHFVYDDFTAPNLSKYLVAECKKGGKMLVFLKPCDTYSFNQLQKEHRIKREMIYVIGIECSGKADVDKIKAKGVEGITGIASEGANFVVETIYGNESIPKYEVMADRCLTCKSKKHMVFDEMIGETGEVNPDCGRFDMVAKLEAMTPDQRFAFWRGELSRCIRCNACRNVCPACTCETCVFDNPNSGIAQKVAVTSFEENMFHIIRAYHVAGRCTDCGECSRVCPQNIPLHLLNRKFIKDMNELYGEYQAGEDTTSRAPLTNYTVDDCEPFIVHERGGKA